MILVLHSTDGDETIVNWDNVREVVKNTRATVDGGVEASKLYYAADDTSLVVETRAVILEMLAIGRSMMAAGDLFPVVYPPQDTVRKA